MISQINKPALAAGSISLSTTGAAYTQNFDSLASSGTSSTVPTGWDYSESGTNANTLYTAGTGSGTAGDTYSFGAASSTERAFGGLLSGSLTPTIGASFTNNTGSPITSLEIAYTGELWRLGALGGRTDRIDFQYSTDATSLITGIWTNVDLLDFTTPNTTGTTTGARDGNDAAYRTSITNTIPGLMIANGASFWIRWVEYNPSGSDDGLAVDDFSLTPIFTPIEPKINEFSASTAGTDVEFVEIFGSATTDYSAYKILEIEGDASGQGVVDEVISLGTTDTNGFYLASLAANALENGSISLLLVKNFSGALTNDLDTNNDGVFDLTPWTALTDSIGVNDGGVGDLTYGLPALTVAYDGMSYAPGGASRIPDGYDTEAAADWVRNDFDLAGIPGNTGTLITGEALNTPGATNALVVLDIAPTIVSNYPTNGAADVPMNASITVTFSEPVTIAAGGANVLCTVSGAHLVGPGMSSGDTILTLDPLLDFTPLESCTVTVTASAVTDQDVPLDNLAADYSFTFTVMADPCTLTYTPIYSIQGTTDLMALTGTQTTMGVVVGDFEGSSALRGFFIQDPTGDANSATSDGIFVFEGSNANSVNLGDLVRVTGTAAEFQGQSQISIGTPVICSTGNTITPTDVTLPVADATFLERFEGMLVRFTQQLYVTENYYLGRFGQVTLSSGDRLHTPTALADPGAPALALNASNHLNMIIVDDSTNNQNPDPIVFGRGGNPLSASNTLRGGDTLTNLVGVLNYTYGGDATYSPNAYRVRPVTSMSGYYNFAATNPRPTSAPAVGGTATIVGMNVLNYFNTFGATSCTYGVGGAVTDGCRGADNLTEFNRQWPKTVAAIIAMNPDVLGIAEMENDGYGPTSAIQDLVTKLNAVAGAGTYAFIDVDSVTGLTNAMGADAIKNGILYKPASVTPVGTTAVLNTTSFVNGGDGEPRNRVSLLQAFQDNSTGAIFLANVNHLKSKGSACDTADAGDGQGNCNAVRLAAVNELITWFGMDPTGTADPDIIMLGDLNSYAKEDPIVALEAAGFINAAHAYLGDAAYSYVFDENVGGLDYAIVSPTFYSQTSGVQEWHVNADEPAILDYNTNYKSAGLQASLYDSGYYRNGDHDPVVVGFNPDGSGPTAAVTEPLNGQTLTAGIHELTVKFNKDVLHDGSEFAGDNPANYMLVEDGASNVFDTLTCAIGPQADDVVFSVDSVVYDPTTFTAVLTVNGGNDLPEGRFRLFVCGTGSIRDPLGNTLNNGEFDTIMTFGIAIPAAAATLMPSTGFAPDRITDLPAQTTSYAGLGDLWLEIPSLKVKTAIVGVPITDTTWDVTWLGNQAGWLEGSSYPTAQGNSVLTAHVWDALNKPGTFFAINKLQYGQTVIVHSYGKEYVYEVRQVLQVNSSNVKAMLKVQEDAWLTLVTCQGWNETSEDYNYRVLVRAVLVDVK